MGIDIGIDLGTSSVLVYVKEKGIVIEEPSVIAIDKVTNKILKVGREAQLMLGRTPGNIFASYPIQNGVLSQYDLTVKLLRHFIKKAIGINLFKPRVLISVPCSITEVEERALCDAAIQAGAKKVYLIESTLSAAIGAGIDVAKPMGNMLVDIGGGTTDIAVLSLGGIVLSDSIKIAGSEINREIIKYIRHKYNTLIGEKTAEELKIKIGSAWPFDEVYVAEIKGRCLLEGLPKLIAVNSAELFEIIEKPSAIIADSVCHVLERTAPELLSDISAGGILLTGGGSQLYGIDRLIEHASGIKTYIAENPIQCTVVGTGRSLEHLEIRKEGVINISRQKYSRM